MTAPIRPTDNSCWPCCRKPKSPEYTGSSIITKNPLKTHAIESSPAGVWEAKGFKVGGTSNSAPVSEAFKKEFEGK